jgi:hypothetical protein
LSNCENEHLLRKVQRVAKRAGVKFHTEIRKTGASRRYLAGVPLTTLMMELGHESLSTTQKYLADVRKPGEVKKAISDADVSKANDLKKDGGGAKLSDNAASPSYPRVIDMTLARAIARRRFASASSFWTNRLGKAASRASHHSCSVHILSPISLRNVVCA